MLLILAVGLLQAYKAFSGYDPMKINPKTSLSNLMSPDGIYEFITGLLTLSPKNTLEKAKQALGNDSGGNLESVEQPKGELEYSFAVLADSHKDTANLKKALEIAKIKNARFVIVMGDLSDIGTVDELRNSKAQFDASGMTVYVTPGDHDLWDSRDKKNPAEKNFMEVFGPPYQAFTYGSARFIIIFNSDNYLGLDSTQLKWIEEELEKYKSNPANHLFIAAPTPLYHPSSDHVMGKVTPKLKDQAAHLISLFKQAGADEVFSSDTHFFTRFEEPSEKLKMTTVGAVTADRNPQTPRFALVDVYSLGGYNIEEVEIK